ncbi:two-component system response regulator (stage 0 sporulation protein F) [Desulfohalotomaculum tongense]|uniref:response regulator n=1 Tax=Desulforadius tongensis TaxID=1216062 RepID=UPI00195DFEDC|nr:response regulator [Desulforadius tongensis]MBM7855358.1 two-component system response regulator (stage 0 sporulation protein F) [Desulforadius tongensis]
MTSKPLNILIVDDQSGVRYLLEILIKEAGHNASTAKNGQEAVEAVRKGHYDLIFMDIRMPVMDGLEALSKIKMMASNVEVVMMTANNTEDIINKSLEGGALKCMAKPFDVEDIRDTIDEFIWSREMRREEMKNSCAM